MEVAAGSLEPGDSVIPATSRAVALPVLLLAITASGCATVGPAADPAGGSTAAEAQVRAAVGDFVEAWEAEDTDAVVSFFTPDAVAFDPAPPGRWEGAADIRDNWVAPAFEFLEDVQIDTRAVRVDARGDVSWVTAAYTFQATTPDGPYSDAGNLSMVWVRQPNGSWRVAVFHASPPIEG